MNTKKQTIPIADGVEAYFISEVYNGEVMDTQVLIGEEHICCISGSQIKEFVEEMAAVIEKFRI